MHWGRGSVLSLLLVQQVAFSKLWNCCLQSRGILCYSGPWGCDGTQKTCAWWISVLWGDRQSWKGALQRYQTTGREKEASFKSWRMKVRKITLTALPAIKWKAIARLYCFLLQICDCLKQKPIHTLFSFPGGWPRERRRNASLSNCVQMAPRYG